MSKPSANWLLSELPGLERAGIVDAATAARLRAHYQVAADDRGFALGLSGILGELLVGLGVLLLLATKWASRVRGLRLSVGAIPLIAHQLQKSDWGQVWQEDGSR